MGPCNRFGSKYGDDVAKVRRLDARDGKRQAVWHLFETGWPFSKSAAQGGRAISLDQPLAAAWHAIIAGARGIIWFQHSFAGPCVGDHHTIRSNCEGTRPEVTGVNGQDPRSSPGAECSVCYVGHSATDTMDGTVRYMVKWSNGKSTCSLAPTGLVATLRSRCRAWEMPRRSEWPRRTGRVSLRASRLTGVRSPIRSPTRTASASTASTADPPAECPRVSLRDERLFRNEDIACGGRPRT
jgi:hypothetical protein